jgi:hypothetical protein
VNIFYHWCTLYKCERDGAREHIKFNWNHRFHMFETQYSTNKSLMTCKTKHIKIMISFFNVCINLFTTKYNRSPSSKAHFLANWMFFGLLNRSALIIAIAGRACTTTKKYIYLLSNIILCKKRRELVWVLVCEKEQLIKEREYFMYAKIQQRKKKQKIYINKYCVSATIFYSNVAYRKQSFPS